ncbi:hypothetical protein [Luteimonas aquatica]|uniref:hypothetical protein n=1 Tax=Luteimonas aquatica TaxID=450364 RepID=UPI001F5916D1|nr:hypothetical protein [Luteimonas aquatica]
MLTLCLLLPLGAGAESKAPPPDPTRDPVMISAGFLSGHPDLRYRLLGMERRKQEKLQEALKFFQRAAFYADKPSQGMVAEMLWNGQGAVQDRAAAYAWMDLAAERGYVGFLGLREQYWEQLSEEERKRALEVGQDLYARYGDAAAQPRIAQALRRERLRMTGSRTGFTGNLQIFVPSPGGGTTIDGSKFYDKRYWDPKQYQQWHDSIWAKPRIGRVSVGEVETVKEEAPAVKTRVPATAPQQQAVEPETPDEMPKLQPATP